MSLIEAISVVVFFVGFTVLILVRELQMIKKINAQLDPEKYNKINLLNRKTVLPKVAYSFLWKKDLKNVEPIIKGVVFKKCYVLTTIAYLYFLSTMIFLAMFLFFGGQLFLLFYLTWMIVFFMIVACIQEKIEKEYKKRTQIITARPLRRTSYVNRPHNPRGKS